MEVLSNFSRIITLTVPGYGQIECAAVRIGPTDIRYHFLILDEEEDEMIAPSAVLDYTYKAVVDSLFSQPTERFEKEALKVWERVEESI